MQPGQFPQPVRPQYRPIRVRWVATPPPGALPQRHAAPPERYHGPPRYATTPRWGFPNLTWRSPTAVPGTASDVQSPVQRLRVIARSTYGSLWFLACLALVAGGAEIWRYVLLVQSRDSALTTSVVEASDGLVVTAGLLATIFSLVPAALTLWWLFVARLAAADAAEEEPSRTSREVLLGMLVPGLNLVMAGSIMAELEHSVLRRSPDRRPTPSRLVFTWWGLWVLNWLLLAAALWWRMRDGIQAMADSVILVALTDFAAAALAITTAILVRRTTELLAPITLTKTSARQVLKVTGAPDPELRPTRAFNTRR
ncbi:DUF4328 domain-containing protein [Amycolatopsis sp. cg5]|uniref:DUF4328 domain-containing protein n=1 Tax=Amycolatopsis sp. cg5 TaxID=3238802 RepID=UPI00352596E3